MKRLAILFMATFMLSACGTIRTLGEGPVALPVPADDEQTCASISRVYSGVQYDYCYVNYDDGTNWELFNLLFWDYPLSFIADTVVLPYTLVRQLISGDIEKPPMDRESKRFPPRVATNADQ